MERVSEHYVEIVELQRAVGARLAKFVGAEAANGLQRLRGVYRPGYGQVYCWNDSGKNLPLAGYGRHEK